MSLQRKVERNQLKQQWKEHNKGVAKDIDQTSKDFGDGFKKERVVKSNGSNDN